MQFGSWEIGRALGIPIRVHVSWFLVFFLVTSSLASGYLPANLPGLSEERYWAMGAVAALLLFGSVLLHELGHAYVALTYRIAISQITLFIFGGVAQMRAEPPHPRAEFLIAIAGPAVSVVLGVVCLGAVELAGMAGEAAGWRGLLVLGSLVGFVNLQLGLFNLIPGFPLDGGRVLRAGLWAWGKDFYRATVQASWGGLVFGVLFGLAGVIVVIAALSGDLPGSMASDGSWIILVATFLFAAALASRRQARLRQSLAAVPVHELMVRTVVAIPPDCTVADAVNQFFVPHGYGGFPVVANGELVGLVTVMDVQAVPQTLWAWKQIGQIMRPASPGLRIEPNVPVLEAMQRMSQEGLDRLVVVQEGQVTGLVTHSAIVHYLQLHKV
ncbi:site-2 protease family protein [Nitrospira lenta]|uniref:Zinc metalloprotease n=1 Tax=Nitrospira lenta TaxID=1436998 RepID=A0A330L356_9BACT|nr:site-2 protease family protein [Nitrospira lenta]SPP63767.1 putative Membrane-associated zinc metallopeptidase containing CBS domain pair [Nitrospira lenta]